MKIFAAPPERPSSPLVRRASWPSRGWTSSTPRCRRRRIRTRRRRSLFYRRQEESWWAPGVGVRDWALKSLCLSQMAGVYELDRTRITMTSFCQTSGTVGRSDDGDFRLRVDGSFTHWCWGFTSKTKFTEKRLDFFRSAVTAPVPYLTRFINICSFKTLPAFPGAGLSSSSQATRLLYWDMKDKYYIIIIFISHKSLQCVFERKVQNHYTLKPEGPNKSWPAAAVYRWQFTSSSEVRSWDV